MIKFEKIKGDVRKHFPELVELFKKDQDVVAVYLFGSYGRDDIGSLSDVDIAVLLEPRVSSVNYFEKQLQLVRDACHLLHTGEVDLVVLNEAPLTFKYGVISDSKVIYCANEEVKIDFETRAMLDYLDTEKIRDEYFFYLHKRIREGDYGVKLEKYRDSLEQTARLFRSS